MLPEVRTKLLEIAADFQEFLGVSDLDVKDITISGSNAAYSYTPQSDIDLHLVVQKPEQNNDVYQELFNAKKYQYNDMHDIRVRGADVELYVQPADETPVSLGEYSIVNDEWIQVPRRRRADIDHSVVKHKYEDLAARIDNAIKDDNSERIGALISKIKTMRQSGLDKHGEFGSENVAYKMLRAHGLIQKLYDAQAAARDRELSLNERGKKKKRVRYAYGGYWAPGFAFGSGEGGDGGGGGESIREVSITPDGVNPSTKMFLEQESAKDTDIVKSFAQYVGGELGLDNMPRIIIKRRPEWAEQNGSFGQYVPELNELTLSLHGRHIVDVLRTLAHELTHAHQQQTTGIPDNGGDTGSKFENQANARAGEFMRHFADAHPEYFAQSGLQESSGYIPTNAEKNDPRFVMALSPDVRPGATGKNANKMSLKTDSQGRPQQARANGLLESLAREFALLEDEFLGEINMSPSNLRQEAARTGAIAGMEFEMIVPNTESDDGDLEPDYDQDERCRSIDDAVQFFHDGDYNGRREVERLRQRMQNDFQEWLDDKLYQDWERGGEEYLEDWVPNNVDESEWNPEGLEGEDRQEALEEYISKLHADPGSSDAFDEYRDENYGSYDESDWLDAEDLDRMSGVENAYEISWPYWSSSGGGEASIEDVAQEFENAIGRDTKASGSYHSGRVPRPSPTSQHYVVEPDGSLDGDNPGDTGLEFVSPPLPIDEILSDLNKVKAWAGEYGCYTNDSTGLHINISVPGYSRENLDFVKLALLLGDKYVLDSFGRAGNTYAKSALDMVRDRVRGNPDDAAQLLNKMKGNLDSLASKAIHSGITQKYTSINTKDGHIEFRSPGGDWLDENFDQIENTLLRFTVAMSAALNPEAYREEYLKKLYKLLTENNKDDADTIKYFSEYVAGKIPKAALRSFVKQAQLTRQVQRDKTGGKKMWWRVGRPGYGASAEVVAASKEEAIALGKKEYPEWDYSKDMTATPVRPYEEPTTQTQPGNWGIWIRALDRFANEPGSYSRNETPPLKRFPSREAAEQWIEQQRATRPNLRNDIEVREIEPAVQDTGSATSGNWGIWVPVLDRWATMNLDGESVTRRFADQARANAWIQDYNARNPGSELELTAQEIEPGADANVNYEIYNRETGEVVDTTQLRNDDEAQIRLDDYRAHGPHRLNTQDAIRTFGIRRGPGVTNTQTDTNPLRPTGPGPWEVANRANNQVYFNPPSTYRRNAESEARTWLSNNGHNPNEFEVRTRQTAGNADAASQSQYQYTSTPIPGVQDVELDIPLAPRTLTRPAQGQQQWTGEWLILDPEGRELHRFGGIGNVQSDANRHAMNWLRARPGTMQAGVTVVPEMQ
jgi:hypothetical protein